MSQARKCFGASGLSLLPSRWALDLKMLALFYFGAGKRTQMKDQFQEIKAEIRNRLQAPKAALDLVSANENIPKNLLKLARQDLNKINKLLSVLKQYT